MKLKNNLSFLFLLLPFCAICQAQNSSGQHFVVEGTLHFIKDPATVYLFYQDHGFHKDTAIVKDGHFVLTGTVSFPMKAFLLLAQEGHNANSSINMDQVAVYLQNGKVLVQSPDSLKRAKISGTPLNVDQQEYINAIGNIRELQSQLIQKFNQNKDNAALQDSIKNDYAQLDILLQGSLANFIKTHPNSIVALNALRSHFNPSDNVELATSLYRMLSPSIKELAAAKAYEASIEDTKNLSIGKVAPDFAAVDTSGKEIHLSDFHGKYVLLDFWASWCGPCRRETPNLTKGFADYQNKNFTILSFSVDENPEDWKKALTEDHYIWQNVRDLPSEHGSVPKKYNVSAIPTNYLIDPQGKIIAMNLRGSELEQKLAEILK